MITYNTGHKHSKIIEPPSQEDIYNCPYYYAMSYDQVKKSGAPEFLMNLLDQFPFDGRKNLLQIRPQDFRNGIFVKPEGNFWHLDDSVGLLDSTGKPINVFTKDLFEWHLMVISWGAGCNTQFITTPMISLAQLNQPFEIMTTEKNQMVEYTSRDLHRADGICHSTGLRLMIVAFDCNDLDGCVRVLPSIRETDGK